MERTNTMMRRRDFLTGTAALAGCATQRDSAAASLTRGGAGGEIIRVTNLSGAGPGSFRAAIEAQGPRIVVFEVGGVIDLERISIRIREPFLTIAGQTAPGPGITLIRGGLNISAHDVVMRHIAVRPGDAERTGDWEPDGLSTVGGHNVIVDHCSLTWAVDENLSASGPRFQGADLNAWREATSHRILYSNNLVAEALSHSTHSKGEHSKGTLIHDNCTDVVLHRNLYVSNVERHPLAKGGSQCAVVNNVFVNPGKRCGQYTLVAQEWEGHAPVEGVMALVGNVMRAGADTRVGLPMLTVGGAGDLALYSADNIAFAADGAPAEILGYYNAAPNGLDAPNATIRPNVRSLPASQAWPAGLRAAPALRAEAEIYAQCGARPWARDPVDQRIVDDARARRSRIIDSQNQVGGYPVREQASARFDPAAWNLETMTRR